MKNQYRIGDYETTYVHDENPWGRIIADWRVEGETRPGLVHGEGEVIVSLPVENAESGNITIIRRRLMAKDAIEFAHKIIEAAESTKVSQRKS